jgi:hypothetical protein
MCGAQTCERLGKKKPSPTGALRWSRSGESFAACIHRQNCLRACARCSQKKNVKINGAGLLREAGETDSRDMNSHPLRENRWSA